METTIRAMSLIESGNEDGLAAIKAYLPEEHRDLVEVTIRGLDFKSKSPAMEMYGSIVALQIEAIDFQKIVGCETRFGKSLTDPVTMDTMIYRSFRHREFIYKQCYLTMLLDRAVKANGPPRDELIAIICYYMRTKEQELDETFELAPLRKDLMDQFQETVRKELLKSSTIEKQFELADPSFNGLLEKFKKILPKHKQDPDYEAIRKALIVFCQRKTLKKNKKFYEKLLHTVAIIIRMTEEFINKHPELFLPKTNKNAVVRIFKDDNNEMKLVLAHEVLLEMTNAGLNCRSIEEEVMKMPALSTWSFKDLMEKIGRENFQNIEFICTPILRTRHRAHYIPTIDGKYCLFATDVILELLHDMIIVKGLFQDVSAKELDALIGYVSFAVRYFTLEWEHIKSSHFINLDVVNSFRSSFYSLMRETIPEVMSKKKMPVSEVDESGFNKNDVAEELKRLGVVKTFPEITIFVEETVNLLADTKQKPEPTIRIIDEKDLKKGIRKLGGSSRLSQQVSNTYGLASAQAKVTDPCLMFDALRICQIECIVRRSELLGDFFHEYESCKQFDLECSRCKERQLEEFSKMKVKKLPMPMLPIT